MNEDYKKRLIELAKEIHGLQLEASKEYKGLKKVEMPWIEITITSKINYLIGYITALGEEK